MRIDVRSSTNEVRTPAAIGVALALALCVWAAGASTGWAHMSSASNALSPKAAKVDNRAINKELAMETAVFGREHAAEHAALLPRGAQVGRARPPAAPEQPEGGPFVGGAQHWPPRRSPSQVGEWTQAPFQLPTFAINTTVLPTGKVLIWGRPPVPGGGSPRPNVGEAALWSPWLGTGPSAFQESRRR